MIYFDQHMGPAPSPLQERALKEAYLTLYALLGADLKDHFFFTSSGAEGVNHAVMGAYLDITRKTGKNHFLCSSLDEAPAIMAMSRLQELNCVFQMVPACEEGYVTAQAIAEMITPRTAMLSLSAGNGLTGVLQPLHEIAALCQERGILLHIEASQLLGKTEFSARECGADIVTFEAPLGGIGGFWMREKKEISSFILGGKEQAEMRAGALFMPAVMECAKWAKQARAESDHFGIEIARLRAYLEECVCARIPSASVLFSASDRLPHIASFLIPYVASDALYFALQQNGVQAAIGGGKLQHFVHILRACGIEAPACHTGISFSLTAEIGEEEIEKGVEILAEAFLNLNRCSEYLCRTMI